MRGGWARSIGLRLRSAPTIQDQETATGNGPRLFGFGRLGFKDEAVTNETVRFLAPAANGGNKVDKGFYHGRGPTKSAENGRNARRPIGRGAAAVQERALANFVFPLADH
jgi:hypothetical protein